VPRAIQLESIHVPFVDQLTRRPRLVLVLAGLATVLSLWALPRVRFDYNLLNLQAPGTESVAWERRLLASAGRSGFAALTTAGSLDELRQKHEAFRRLPSVSEVDSALLLIPDHQAEKQKIIQDFAALVGHVRIGRPLPVDLGRLAEALGTLRRRLDIAATEAPEGDARRELARVVGEIDRLLAKLGSLEPEVSEPLLTNLQRQLYRDFVRSFQRLQANLSPKTIGLADIPREIRAKFVSAAGRFLIQVHPAVNIWERDDAARFVAELRQVDPDITGTPIITFEAIRLMERAYRQGTVYAIVLVAGLTFLLLRRFRQTLLALAPLALGLVWTAGLMSLFDLPITMGNVFAVPLVLGAASEYGLNLVIRFREGYDHGGPLVARSTVMGVLVAGLTTIVGFGSLMLADHRGIFGLGLLLTLGTVTSLVAALIVLPVLMRVIYGPRPPRPAGITEPTPAQVQV
jgi:predicted RND superfamily exporter protein